MTDERLEEQRFFIYLRRLLELRRKEVLQDGVTQVYLKVPLMRDLSSGLDVKFHLRIISELTQALVLDLESVENAQRPTQEMEDQWLALCEQVLTEIFEQRHPTLLYAPMVGNPAKTGQTRYAVMQLSIHQIAHHVIGYMALFCDEVRQGPIHEEGVYRIERSERVICNTRSGVRRGTQPQ